MSETLWLASLLAGVGVGTGLTLIVNTLRGRRSDLVLPASSRRIDARLVLISAVCGLGSGVVALLTSGLVGLSVAIAALGAGAFPWWRIRQARARSRAAEDAFPELIELVIARVRSGDTLFSALGTAGAEVVASIGRPAVTASATYSLGGNAAVSLDHLKRAWACPAGDLVVETLRISQVAGGSATVDVLRQLNENLRSENNLRRDIDAKQSWVRVAARIGVAAPWVVLVVLSFRPEAVRVYNSPVGVALLVVGLALTAAAYAVMIALGRVSATRRVFEA